MVAAPLPRSLKHPLPMPAITIKRHFWQWYMFIRNRAMQDSTGLACTPDLANSRYLSLLQGPQHPSTIRFGRASSMGCERTVGGRSLRNRSLCMERANLCYASGVWTAECDAHLGESPSDIQCKAGNEQRRWVPMFWTYGNFSAHFQMRQPRGQLVSSPVKTRGWHVP